MVKMTLQNQTENLAARRIAWADAHTGLLHLCVRGGFTLGAGAVARLHGKNNCLCAFLGCAQKASPAL